MVNVKVLVKIGQSVANMQLEVYLCFVLKNQAHETV